MRRPWTSLLLLAACGGDAGVDNEPPVAHLTAQPELARVGETVALVAADSVDPDGVIVSYRFVFSDGTPDIVTGAEFLDHHFARGGRYQLAVVVTDDRGATARADAAVTILEDPPAGGCLADDACRDAERCDNGLCIPTAECSATAPCPAPLLCDDGFCRCPTGTALCGSSCVALATDPLNCGGCGELCAAPSTCGGGVCTPPTDCGDLTLCGDLCVDTTSNVDHCGGCDRPCPDDATCTASMCTGLCTDGLTSCGTLCVDTRTDPSHCGGCGNLCMAGFCSASTCQIAPPGTVVSIIMPPYDGRVTGMTFAGGEYWAMVNGRRLQRLDPVSGELFETFFIEDEDDRRAIGLAATSVADLVVTGAFDQGNPFMAPDFEVYDLDGAVMTSSTNGEGGPAAYDQDAGIIYVFQNNSQELVTFDGVSFAELDRRPVAGMNPFDTLTDLALDGGGHLWGVRPRIGGFTDPLFVNIDIASSSVNYYSVPFDFDWVGGIVLVDGVLWGAGQFGIYQIVP